jgi:acetyltransferase-like isoleucine patch superfamily enzyme
VSSFTKIKVSRGPLRMGDRGGFATGCFVSAGAAGIRIGDNFVCGPNVTISSNTYIHDRPDEHLEDLGVASKGIEIGNHCWVGAGAAILDGTVLGDNTIVVANSLVNRRYPPNSILQGNPARVIMKRFPDAEAITSEEPIACAS